MNNTNMLDDIKIVNTRVLKMLDLSEVNNELFYRDVRTLAELVKLKFEQDKKGIRS